MRYVIGERLKAHVVGVLRLKGEDELADALLTLPDLPDAKGIYLDGYHHGYSQAESGVERNGEIAWESYMLVE